MAAALDWWIVEPLVHPRVVLDTAAPSRYSRSKILNRRGFHHLRHGLNRSLVEALARTVPPVIPAPLFDRIGCEPQRVSGRIEQDLDVETLRALDQSSNFPRALRGARANALKFRLPRTQREDPIFQIGLERALFSADDIDHAHINSLARGRPWIP